MSLNYLHGNFLSLLLVLFLLLSFVFVFAVFVFIFVPFVYCVWLFSVVVCVVPVKFFLRMGAGIFGSLSMVAWMQWVCVTVSGSDADYNSLIKNLNRIVCHVLHLRRWLAVGLWWLLGLWALWVFRSLMP